MSIEILNTVSSIIFTSTLQGEFPVKIIRKILAYLNTKKYETNTLFNQLKKSKKNKEYFVLLGFFHEYGIGTKIDPIAAFQYYKAANAGHAGALIELARCYSEGRGTRQNHRKGFLAWRILASSKSIGAYPWLASAYEAGWGTMKDRHEAIK
ncbi:4602_t:CDS:2, partial [Ambispora leptoticha]